MAKFSITRNLWQYYNGSITRNLKTKSIWNFQKLRRSLNDNPLDAICFLRKICLNIPCRYVLSLLIFFGLINVYTMRINLSVAILEMIKDDRQPNFNSTGGCPNTINVSLTEENIHTGEFYWTTDQKGSILGAFFYGYVVSNIIGGRLTEIVGAKWTFGMGILSTSVLSLLTPVVARWSYYAFVALRVIIGLLEGSSFPAFHCMLGRWIPLRERGFVFMCIQSGAALGSVIGQLLAGVLTQSNLFGGWPSSFYLFGTFGVLWSLFWFPLMHEFPKDHPRISEKELSYIVKEFNTEGHSQKNISLPWKKIITSVPVWAVIIVFFGNNWIVSFDLLEWPTYMNKVLHYSTQETGIWSSFPDFVSIFVSLLASALGDWMLRKGILSVTATRKLLTLLGSVPYIPFTIGIVYLRCNGSMVILLRILYSVASSLTNPGYVVSMIDMAPTFAGTIMGFSNGLTQTTGFIVPQVVGALTVGQDIIYEWQMLFYMNMTIYVVCICFFLIFGTSEVQSWSKISDENHEAEAPEIDGKDLSQNNISS